MNSFDSPGGHIVVCIVLVLVGMGAEYKGVQYGKDLVVFALGIMSRSMIGSNAPAPERRKPEGQE